MFLAQLLFTANMVNKPLKHKIKTNLFFNEENLFMLKVLRNDKRKTLDYPRS